MTTERRPDSGLEHFDLTVKVSPNTVSQMQAVLLAAEKFSESCTCVSLQLRSNLLGQVLIARSALRTDLVLGGSWQ